MIFKDPLFLLLLLALPALWMYKRKGKPATLRFSSFTEIKKSYNPPSVRMRKLILTSLRVLSVAAFIIALARPQSVSSERDYDTEGIDIMLSMDISGSMQAMDFQPDNRMAVAKEEAKKFVQGRKHDRIGIVIFARQSYTQCPLTHDYDVLLRLIDDIQIGLIKDGTAIGLGIANAVNRLRDSQAKSKVVILLTDGANNAGNIDPLTAAELAKSFGIKIYSICIGQDGLVPFPVDDPLFGRRYVQAQVEIDEELLKKVAAITGGLYFRARDPKSLNEIYQKIDKLEKTKVQVTEFSTYNELFPYFLLPAVIGLILSALLECTYYLKVP